MPIIRVPQDFATIAQAIVAAASGDTIQIDVTYVGGETTVTVGVNNLTFDAPASISGIILDALDGSVTNITTTGGSDFQIRGRGGNDTIIGNEGDNVIRGRNGDDTIDGGGNSAGTGRGDDADYFGTSGTGVQVTLTDGAGGGAPTGGFSTGGAGNDTLINIENIRGSDLDDLLTGNSSNNILRGNLGNDTLDGGANFGGFGDSTEYSNAAGAVQVTLTDGAGGGAPTGGFATGAAGNDVLINVEGIRGSDFADTLTGNSGNNLLRGNLGNDTLNGGGGSDWGDYFNSSGAVQVTLTGGPGGAPAGGSSSGAAGVDTLDSIESLRGGNFNDSLTGNGFDNFLRGGLGNDTLTGGGGGDWADYGGANGAVQVTLTDGAGGGAPTGGSSSGADGVDTISDIQNIRGGAFNDTLTGNSLINFLAGGAGADTLNGGGGFDYASYFNATTGVVANLANAAANTGDANGDSYISIEGLRGSAFDDRLTGDANDNRLDGASGEDSLDGGDGIDLARYQTSASAVIVSLATPAINTGDAAGDVFISIEGLQGSSFDDQLTGDGNNNQLIGGIGADTLDGGSGFDFASYQESDDSVGVSASLATPATNTGRAVGDAYTSIEGLIGSNANDLLEGDSTANELRGLNGDDTLIGGASADTLDGSAGNDSLDGGTGADSMVGGAGNDTYIVDSASDKVIEAVGGGFDRVITSVNYTLAAGQEIEKLEAAAGAGALALAGNAFNNQITGGIGNDTLSGGAGTDTLNGGAGNDRYNIIDALDTITDASGIDTVYATVNFTLAAGVGVEIIRANAGATGLLLTGNAFANEIYGNIGNDTLDGSDGHDKLYGNTGNDSLIGGVGNDILSGGGGDDALVGGTGNDIYYVDTNDVITELAGQGTLDRVYATANFTLAAGVDVEQLLAGAGATGLYLTGNELNNAIYGNTGADTLEGAGGNDNIYANYGDDLVNGGDGDDGLYGSQGSDTLNGGIGNDTLAGSGGAGIDSMTGGTGNDIYYVYHTGDIVVENTGEGTDELYATVNYTLAAGVEIETLRVSSGATGRSVTGNEFNQTFWGGIGSDTLSGGDGNDVFNANAGNDSLLGGSGNDTLFGSSGNDILIGGTGNDSLNGGAGNDTFTFNTADFVAGNVDTVSGFGITAGSDDDVLRLQGNAGNYAFATIAGGVQVTNLATGSIINVMNASLTAAALGAEAVYF